MPTRVGNSSDICHAKRQRVAARQPDNSTLTMVMVIYREAFFR